MEFEFVRINAFSDEWKLYKITITTMNLFDINEIDHICVDKLYCMSTNLCMAINCEVNEEE